MRHVLRLRKYIRELCDGCAHLKRKVFQYVSQRSMQARLHSSSMYNRLVYGGISQKDFRWRFSSLPPLLPSSSKWKSAWWVIDSPRALQGRKDLGWVGRSVVEVVGGWVGGFENWSILLPEWCAPVRGRNKPDSYFCKKQALGGWSLPPYSVGFVGWSAVMWRKALFKCSIWGTAEGCT